MEKLKSVLRKPDFKPESYGGFLTDEYQFTRFFFLGNNSLETCFGEVNEFMKSNGFEELDFDSFKKELELDLDQVRLSADSYVNEENRKLILTITRFNPWGNPVDRILLELIKFRNARDWAQFHNSKDLALALNVEASELLELFLWKDNEGANPDKLKEELADVFMYGLLLLEKHGLDFEEILMEKLKINDLKYPVSKSKGSAKKYTDL